MRQGKHICDTLKAIRSEIASANEIDYTPTPCDHEGNCAGTCPACESEVQWLERQLRNRHALGKAVTIAGVSMALSLGASAATPSPLGVDQKRKTDAQKLPKQDERRTSGVVRMPPPELLLRGTVPMPSFSPDSIFSKPDVEAQFPGGDEAMDSLIRDQLYIPDEILEPIKEIGGTIKARCIVKALVELDGTIGDAVIEKTTTADIFDNEALHAVKNLPPFTPASIYGIPVRSWKLIPVEFVYDFSKQALEGEEQLPKSAN